MQRESDDSLSRTPLYLIASRASNPEAEAQQEAIIKEEELSTDALEAAGDVTLPPEDLCSHDYAALIERGRQLRITLAELVATTRTLRAAALSARQRAMMTRERCSAAIAEVV